MIKYGDQPGLGVNFQTSSGTRLSPTRLGTRRDKQSPSSTLTLFVRVRIPASQPYSNPSVGAVYGFVHFLPPAVKVKGRRQTSPNNGLPPAAAEAESIAWRPLDSVSVTRQNLFLNLSNREQRRGKTYGIVPSDGTSPQLHSYATSWWPACSASFRAVVVLLPRSCGRRGNRIPRASRQRASESGDTRKEERLI